MSEGRYSLDKTYTESFFGWGDNATQQKILAEYFVPKIVKEFKPNYVLDVGCGTGQWLDEYTRIMRAFANGTIDYKTMSKNCVSRWERQAKPELITQQHLDLYKELL